MPLDIIIEPNSILHRQAENVDVGEISKMRDFFDDMIKTMREKDGAGLAAPQVGKSLQICAIAKEYTADKKSDLVLINPRWEKASPLRTWDTEGCLSTPHLYGDVRRYNKIKVDALDRNGRALRFIAEDFFARVIQHEADHLRGILFMEKAKKLRKIESEKNGL